MDYSKIRIALIRSDAIRKVSYTWSESVPIKCILNEEEYDSFIFYKNKDSKFYVKRIIGVNSCNGNIVILNENEILDSYGLKKLSFLNSIIVDSNGLSEKKRKYLALYEELCSSEKAYNFIGKEEYRLLRDIMGDDIVDNFISKIAPQFICKLQNGTT